MDRFGYTCPEKDGNDQILEKIGIPSLGMALTKGLRLTFQFSFKVSSEARVE